MSDPLSLVIGTSDNDRTPAPEGLHPSCVCVDVFSLGMVLNKKFGKQEHRIMIVWQLDRIDPETGARYEVAKSYSASMHKKAWLAKDLESWRGKLFTDEERKNFDLNRLVGAPAQLQIIHNAKDDGNVYANVNAVIGAPHLFDAAGKPTIKPLDYVRKIDRDAQKAGNGQAPAQAAPPAQNGQKRATPPPSQPAAAPSGPAPF